MTSKIHGLLVPLLALSLVAASQTQHKPAARTPKPAPAKPADDSQIYRNATFGFRFQMPYGWVDRTKEMREQNMAGKTDEKDATSGAKDKPADSAKTDAQGGEVLLALFERPPDAIGETVNSAVVIASESAASYPALKKSEDYVDPLTELTTSKGFKSESDPVVLDIDSRQLVCVDFTKALNDKLTMHQTTLILLTKGQLLTFTFIAGKEDEIDNLIDGLHFGSEKSTKH